MWKSPPNIMIPKVTHACQKLKSDNVDPPLPPQGPTKALVVKSIATAAATSLISSLAKRHLEDSVDSRPHSHVAPPFRRKMRIEISFNDLNPKVITHLQPTPRSA